MAHRPQIHHIHASGETSLTSGRQIVECEHPDFGLDKTIIMFESLGHWIESIKDESKLFRNAEDEVLHSALASLLYHFISLEEHHGAREKHEFDRLMKQEFDLNQEQIDHLYQTAKIATRDLHNDLLTINSHLKDNPAVRVHFMQKLLQLVDIHGVHSEELDLFYETLHEVFPEVKDVGRNEDY